MGIADILGGGSAKTKVSIPDYIQRPSWTIGDKVNNLLIKNPNGVDPAETDALNGIIDLAGQGSPFAGGATSWLQSLISGGGLNSEQAGLAGDLISGGLVNPAMAETSRIAMGGDLGSNPFLDATYAKAAGKVGEQFRESVIPGLDTEFASKGRLGSSAYALLRNKAEGQLGDTLGDLATGIYGGAYQSDQANRMAALGQLGQLGQADIGNRIAGSDLFNTGVGNVQGGIGLTPTVQGLRYDDLNRMLAAGGQLSESPWRNLQRGANIVGGLQGGSTTTQSTSSNPLNSLLGIGMGVAGLGTDTLGGAGMMAMLSDRRLKADIERLPGCLGGAAVYRYRYLWDEPGTVRMGVMAQEAPPEAVLVTPDGWLAVDYGRL